MLSEAVVTEPQSGPIEKRLSTSVKDNMVFADEAVVRGVVKNIGCDVFDEGLNCQG